MIHIKFHITDFFSFKLVMMITAYDRVRHDPTLTVSPKAAHFFILQSEDVLQPVSVVKF